MKKLTALLLALLLALTGVLAMAEEAPEAVTITGELEINRDAAKALMQGMGMDDDTIAVYDAIIALLDAISEKVVIADGGIEYEMSLNGQPALTLAGEADENGLNLATSLLPSYYFTLSYETVLELIKTYAPFLTEAEESREATDALLASIDVDALRESVEGYFTEYAQTCSTAVVMGEAVQETYEYNDLTFNAKVPIELDLPTLVNATMKLYNQLCEDETVKATLEALKSSNLNFNLEPFEGEVPADELPTVDVAMYFNVDESGNTDDNTLVTVDVTQPDAESPSTLVNVLMTPESTQVVVELPEAETTVGVTVVPFDDGHAVRLDVTAQETYFGADLTVTEGEEKTHVFNFYFSDDETPLVTETVVVKPEGERTYAIADDSRTALSIEEIVTDEDGKVVGELVSDAQTGLFSLIGTASDAVPEAGNLVSFVMGMFMGGQDDAA